MSFIEDLAWRLIELVKEDPELHEALVGLIKAKAQADWELAAWRKRRK